MSFNQLSYHYAYLAIKSEENLDAWWDANVVNEMALAMANNPVLQHHADFNFRCECHQQKEGVDFAEDSQASISHCLLNFGRNACFEEALDAWLSIVYQHIQAPLAAVDLQVTLYWVVHGCNFQDADFYLHASTLHCLKQLHASVQIWGYCFDDGQDFPYRAAVPFEIAYAHTVDEPKDKVCALRIEVDDVHAASAWTGLNLPLSDVSTHEATLYLEAWRHEHPSSLSCVLQTAWNDIQEHRCELNQFKQATGARYALWFTDFLPRKYVLAWSAAEIALLAEVQCDLNGDVYFDTQF